VLLLALALVLVVGPDVAHAQPAVEPRVETLWIPMTEKRLLGGSRALRLEATPYEPTLAWAGRSSNVPGLWLYSENDRNYGPAAIRAYHRAFIGAGGTADLHLFPPIGHDGHILLPRSVAVWAGAVDDYLRRAGLRDAAP
jgi:hypothetical protein